MAKAIAADIAGDGTHSNWTMIATADLSLGRHTLLLELSADSVALGTSSCFLRELIALTTRRLTGCRTASHATKPVRCSIYWPTTCRSSTRTATPSHKPPKAWRA